VIFSVALRTVMILTLIGVLTCCRESRQNVTPDEFRNKTTVDLPTYFAHKRILLDTMARYERLRYRPHNIEMDSIGQIVIDTILYSPQKNKMAFFVIRGPISGGYNAHCYIGLLDDLKIENIRWLDFYNLSFYPSIEQASNRIREIHFTEFNLRQDSGLDYNLDDVRFWNDDDVWKSGAKCNWNLPTLK